MNCRICGSENDVEWRGGNRGALCDSCAADTPVKVTREEFDAAYWEGCAVGENTKREFYSDYRASTYDLAGYIAATCG